MAQKKINKFKDQFIADQGGGMFNLLKEYWNGGREVEHREANRLYNHYAHGLNAATYTIYTIAEGSKIVYVGRTGMTLAKRWSNHKSDARNSVGTQPLHLAMMSTSDPATFPEWTIQAYVTTTDKNAAIELEKLAILAFKTNTDGYNCMIGGGGTSSRFKKLHHVELRPLQ